MGSVTYKKNGDQCKCPNFKIKAKNKYCDRSKQSVLTLIRLLQEQPDQAQHCLLFRQCFYMSFT